MTQATETPQSAPRPRRRWFRYSLSTLLGFVTVLCLVLGLWVQRAERQRRAVAVICSMKGAVHYEDDELVTNTPPSMVWLREWLGNDYFSDVYWLSLSDTQITNAGLDHLRGLPELRVLYLTRMQLTDAGLGGLSRATELEYLYLGETQVTDTGCQQLKGLRNLRVLNLSDTQVGNAGLQHLNGLAKVDHLSLAGTQINDAGLDHLKEMTALRWLNLGRTWVSDEGCERLKGALPNCVVVH